MGIRTLNSQLKICYNLLNPLHMSLNFKYELKLQVLVHISGGAPVINMFRTMRQSWQFPGNMYVYQTSILWLYL